jgi:prephenate dehydrogenase
VEGADIVILAAPGYAIVDYFKTIAPFLKKKAIVLDLGSTKEYIVAAAKKYLPRHVEFIGCHPLCGGEKSGAEFSRKDLYKNAPCFVVNDNFSGFGFKVTKLLWESAGGHVIALSAIEHDRILAFVSHMPHIVSFTMAAELPGYCLDFAGPAFKDMTRVAASPVNVWADIFLSNKDNILNATGKFIEALEKFRKLIKEENKRGVYEFIEKANRKQKNY